MNLDVADDEVLVSEALPPLTPLAHRVSAVLWPSFLMAGVLEMLVFAFVDPNDLHWTGGAPLGLSSASAYTLAFFVFWLVISLAGALTQLLLVESQQLNAPRTNRNWP